MFKLSILTALTFISIAALATKKEQELPTSIKCIGTGYAVNEKFHAYAALNWESGFDLTLIPLRDFPDGDPYNKIQAFSEGYALIGDCGRVYVKVDDKANVTIGVWGFRNAFNSREYKFLGSSRGFKTANIYIPEIDSPIYNSEFTGAQNHCSLQLTCMLPKFSE